MPVTIRFDRSVPSGDQQRIAHIVDLVNQTGLYPRRYEPDLTYDEPKDLRARLKNNPALSGFTSSSRHIYLSPLFDGDRPIEDRFIHELIHVLYPGLAGSAPIGEHPLRFYETEKRLYDAIGRSFAIQDSIYETDSDVYARLTGGGQAHMADTMAALATPTSSRPRRPALCAHAAPAPVDTLVRRHDQQIRALTWIGVIALGAAAMLWADSRRGDMAPLR